ncbi:uncharacterized protein AB675_4456 [Cyphellophora attinorum]|uniref:Ribosomal protein mS38 C-terminal domain-containing protein n=1 Tax=Cyphellophora attinorum TaxID=1664694 RepID=A0A0N0NLC1_9EURO|nr:uncharacterized protein AB675_4456 [Phialophora attinorum]KPI39008.1 hypothetical protein AB675_4456 [Phialophora attinorum]
MFKSSLRQAGRTALPIRSTSTPSIATAPLSSCTHQRRHSSSKRPVPPNNGSPEVPTDVKEVSPSATKTESKDVTKERPSRKKAATALKAAEAVEAQNNWTSTMPRVPSLHHLSPKDMTVAAFYATYRPISITGPGPKEFTMKDVEKIFQPKPARTKAKESEVMLTLSSAVDNLNNAIDSRQSSTSPASSQKELLRVVDSAGNSFKIVRGKDIHAQPTYRHFQPPPPPEPYTQERIYALAQQNSFTETETYGEELLAQHLEQQVQDQDSEGVVTAMVIPRRRRTRRFQSHSQSQAQKFRALLTPQPHTQHAEIVLNTAALREHFNFFTPTDPTAVAEEAANVLAHRTVTPRQRRGLAAVADKQRRPMAWRLISVKRQRKLKMKKHKYKKLMRRTRTLRKRQDKI